MISIIPINVFLAPDQFVSFAHSSAQISFYYGFVYVWECAATHPFIHFNSNIMLENTLSKNEQYLRGVCGSEHNATVYQRWSKLWSSFHRGFSRGPFPFHISSFASFLVFDIFSLSYFFCLSIFAHDVHRSRTYEKISWADTNRVAGSQKVVEIFRHTELHIYFISRASTSTLSHAHIHKYAHIG